MSVGMFDQDLALDLWVPNLELMKLSTYYKQQKEFVVLVPQPEQERFTKLFACKDSEDNEKIFTRLAAKVRNNTFLLGKSISENYSPMEEKIEMLPQDVSLYKRFATFPVVQNKFKGEIGLFEDALKGTHLRLSLDGKTVWNYYKQQLRGTEKRSRLYFHDYNIAQVAGAREEILKLFNERTSKQRVRFKFPLRFESENELLNWTSLPIDFANTEIIFQNIMTNKTKEIYRFLHDKNLSTNFKYCVSARSFTEDEFQILFLPKIYLQIIKQRMLGVRFFLEYERGVLTSPEWEDVFWFLNKYLFFNHYMDLDEYASGYEFAVKFLKEKDSTLCGKDKFSYSRIKNAFYFLKNRSPKTFKLIFNDNFYNLTRGKYD